MAEQTIIVMSDSHGERDIVADIKNKKMIYYQNNLN